MSIWTCSSSPSRVAASRGGITANSTLRPAGKVPGAGTHRKPNRLPTESPTVPRSSVSPAAEVNVYCLPLSEMFRR